MSKISIRSRIVISFTLIALFVGVAFTLGIHSIFDSTEDELMSLAMDTKLKLIVSSASHSNKTLNEFGLHLYSSENPDPHMPQYLAKIPLGFTEIKNSHMTYFAYRQIMNGNEYILVLDPTVFEDEFEENVFLALRSGLFLTIVLGGLVGWFLAKKILSPIVKLTEVFAQRKLHPFDKGKLAYDFPDDEIGVLAHAFEDAYSKIQDALWRERLFTSDVSHEFRSGLMVISSSCELLLKHKSKEDPDYQVLEKITRASAEMQQLIQSLLVLARSEHTVVNPTKAQTLSQITHEAFSLWQPAFLAKKIEFRFTITNAPTEAKFNADLLLTALSNLLKNALNYTENGTVQLSLQDYSISVTDTGVGITLDNQRQVMQPFVRGSTLPLDGLGLGLSLVQRICENQGWRLHLHSRPGQGSTFTIELGSY